MIRRDEIVGPGSGQWYAESFNEFHECFLRMRQPDSSTRQDHRSMGAAQKFDDFAQPARVDLGMRLRASREFLERELVARRLQVAWNVEPYRSGSTSGGQTKRLGQHMTQFFERSDVIGAFSH